jgi:two-component system, cell cycle sensor histidine kinase and response regulator CckA
MAAGQSRSLRPLILVVDDDEVTRKVVQIILKTHGFRVFLASTSQDAMRICARFGSRIGVVITEVRIPGMSGFDLAEQIGRVLPGMPVLLMSGSFFRGDSELRQRIQPGTGFLAKPFTQKVLLSKLDVLMAPRSAAAAASRYN